MAGSNTININQPPVANNTAGAKLGTGVYTPPVAKPQSNGSAQNTAMATEKTDNTKKYLIGGAVIIATIIIIVVALKKFK